MDEVRRAIAEREVGRIMLKILEVLDERFFEPKMEATAAQTLENIQKAMNDENLSDFECIDVIVDILACAGIHTNRHDFG